MTETDKITQHQQVLSYIEDHGSITPQDAFRAYGITRLSARVFELRKKGFPIETAREHGRTSTGHRTVYARYFMEQAA